MAASQGWERMVKMTIAWAATVVKILRRADAETVGKWLAELNGAAGPEKLSVDRKIAVA